MAFLNPVSAVVVMDDAEEDIITTSSIYRYSARPDVLQTMCKLNILSHTQLEEKPRI
ncbi:hypothetical protein DPMN_113013 [Dreissena polymorpha]|uniref:Uncharacterized protein n=1 Tax=Dreissena polymorpha TaxID=45954 RepID=A0A9D4QQA1_DREPO|nr:hypothetical protein DPMN_113013 [Dreissena polymorpha]